MGCTDLPSSEDIYSDMVWEICRHCGNIQLKYLVPLEILYSTNHNDAVGNTWAKHNEAFACFIQKFAPTNVIEIGGASGKIAKFVLDGDARLNSWTLLEPNPIVAYTHPKLKVVKSWIENLDAELCANKDIVVHSHVMEHFYFPDLEIQRIARQFPDSHKVVLSVPNLRAWLEAKFSNALMFEHSYFLDESAVTFLMNKNGYNLAASEKFGEHSLFYCFEKSSDDLKPSPPRDYLRNKELFAAYIAYCKREGESIAEKITNLPSGTPVFLFGAHIFSQILIHFGVPQNSISAILDNSDAKKGRRLYGLSLMVDGPEVISNLDRPAVVLRAGAYTEEIAKQLRAFNPHVRIL